MRYFNTSGPNVTKDHFTLMRPELVAEGLDKVHKDRYLTYRKALAMTRLDMDLYLAVPKKSFDTIFQKELVKELVKEYKVNLIVYSSKNQTVVSWIKQ